MVRIIVDVLLGQNLLTAIRSAAGETFTFQHENAPRHRARNTAEDLYLFQRAPAFCQPIAQALIRSTTKYSHAAETSQPY